ncbi:MAG: DEAD/DEAH box helicase [Andreesenia angusta]|nr:DEAD/DEAH box helicase [Andreesenia angusta]
MSDFKKLKIRDELTDKLWKKGIRKPTEIQKLSIPEILSGKDIIGKAKTGTGKTLAFILPIIQNLDMNRNNIQALIITPTRELATQISKEIKELLKDSTDCLLILGGQDIFMQIRKLGRTPKIVVGTPGRLIDHLDRNSLDIGKIKYLVLDEADQMLDMGFLGLTESIIKRTPKRRQTLLFSATIPNEVKRMAKVYMKNPKEISTDDKQVTVENIRQIVVETTDRKKLTDLIKIFEEENPFLAIIFCRTKNRVKKLNLDLGSRGYNCDELHGDLSQAKRQRAMKNFRDMKTQYLIATDLAARGLDIEGITHVFNYDMPEDTTTYIHRIGRTGRAGDRGIAYTFVTEKNMDQFRILERKIKKNLIKWKAD